MEDAKIIALFWERNEQAVQETDTAYGRKLYALSNHILNNREDAEEMTYRYGRIVNLRFAFGFCLCENGVLEKVKHKLQPCARCGNQRPSVHEVCRSG